MVKKSDSEISAPVVSIRDVTIFVGIMAAWVIVAIILIRQPQKHSAAIQDPDTLRANISRNPYSPLKNVPREPYERDLYMGENSPLREELPKNEGRGFDDLLGNSQRSRDVTTLITNEPAPPLIEVESPLLDGPVVIEPEETTTAPEVSGGNGDVLEEPQIEEPAPTENGAQPAKS